MNLIKRQWKESICAGLLLTLFFFNADSFIGAIGLRDIYTRAGSVCVVFLFLIVLMIRDSIEFLTKNWWVWLILGLVFGGCTLSALSSADGIIFLGLGLAYFPLAAGVPTESIILLLMLLIIFYWGLITFTTMSEVKTRVLLIFILICTGISIIAFSGPSRSLSMDIPAHLQFHGKHYFVYAQQKFVSSSADYLALYQCDEFVIYCKKIYSTPGWFYSVEGAPVVVLEADEALSTIEITVNGEFVHTQPIF